MKAVWCAPNTVLFASILYLNVSVSIKLRYFQLRNLISLILSMSSYIFCCLFKHFFFFRKETSSTTTAGKNFLFLLNLHILKSNYEMLVLFFTLKKYDKIYGGLRGENKRYHKKKISNPISLTSWGFLSCCILYICCSLAKKSLIF